MILLLACAPQDCGFGYVEVAGECVVSGDGGDPADDTGTEPTETDVPVGYYTCPDGEGRENTGGRSVRGMCGTCDGFTCTYTVFLAETYGEIGHVEIDLVNTIVGGAETWFEFHNDFDEDRSDAGGANWSIELGEIEKIEEYESNETTWIILHEPEQAAATSFQASAFAEDWTFLDCFAWGPNTAEFGSECSVVD